MLLTVEKLIYGGDGLAHTEPDASGRRQAVFVPFVLPGEQVEAAETGHGHGFLRARVDKVVTPAPQRAEPPCPYFGACGGCHYQHADYAFQLESKAAILRETLRRTGGIDWQEQIHLHPSPPWHYRNRTRLQVMARDGGFTLAYFRLGSHALLPVERCPISSELIERAIAAITQFGRERRFPAGMREIEFFADAEDAQLMLELYLLPAARLSRSELRTLLSELRGKIPELATLVAFPFSSERGGAQSSNAVVAGEPHLLYRVGEFQYRVGPGAFFQTNRFMTVKLIELATAGRSGQRALDLYSGVGLFSLPLARSFKEVIAVETAPASISDLQHNVPANVQVISATSEQFFSGRPAPSADYAVVDPPRAGLGERVSRSIGRLAPAALTYASCDPATLARDLKILTAGGFRIAAMHLVDLFPQTFHIETVVHLARA